MEDEPASTLGAFVRARRAVLGLLLTDLARRADLTKSELSAIENGKIALPGADKRRRLAAALGVSHEALLVAAGELAPDEAGRLTEPRRFSPESGYDAVLSVLDRMSEEEAAALARTGEILLELRRPRTVAAQPREKVPALG